MLILNEYYFTIVHSLVLTLFLFTYFYSCFICIGFSIVQRFAHVNIIAIWNIIVHGSKNENDSNFKLTFGASFLKTDNQCVTNNCRSRSKLRIRFEKLAPK